MSNLRQQVDELRDEYQSQRYAGDLSLLIEPTTPTRRRPRWRSLAVFAVAAALLMAVWLRGAGDPGVDPEPKVANLPGRGAVTETVRQPIEAKPKPAPGALRLDRSVLRRRIELPTAASAKKLVETRRAFSLGYRKYRPAFVGGKRVPAANNLARRTPSRPATTVALTTAKATDPVSSPVAVRPAYDSSVPRINRISSEFSLQSRS